MLRLITQAGWMGRCGDSVSGSAWNICPPAESGDGVAEETAVPRYLFTIHDSKPTPDTVGIHLSGPEEARSMAIAEASEMLRDHRDRAGWPTPSWWVHVTDEEQGTTVCRLTVSGTAENS